MSVTGVAVRWSLASLLLVLSSSALAQAQEDAGVAAAPDATPPDSPGEEGDDAPAPSEDTPDDSDGLAADVDVEPTDTSSEAPAEPHGEEVADETPTDAGAEPHDEPVDDQLDLFADMSLEDLLSPQVVSASLQLEDAWQALAIISVITSEAMREYGYLSIGDALRYEPGVYAVYDHVTYNLGVRGVNGGMGAQSQVVRTMLEGRDIRFRSTGGSFFGPELLPRLGIRQAEVIRGPVSALYGADAFLGAVNLIANRAADMGPGNARMELHTLSQGTNWGVQADGAAWGRPFDIDSVVSVTYRDLERGGLQLPTSSPNYDSLLNVLETDRVTDDRERAASVLGRFEGSWGDGSLTLETNLQYFERGANFTFESSPLSGGRISLYNFGAALRLDQNIDDKIRIRAFTSYSNGGPTARERLIDLQRATIPYARRTLSNQTSETRAEVTYTDEIPDVDLRFAVTLGGDYTFDLFDSPSVIGVRQPDPPIALSPPSEQVQFHNGAGFLQLAVTILDWLRVLGGLRVEGHNLYGEQVSYRAGIGYSDEHFTARLLFGRSFKAPTVSLLYAQPLISGGATANPNLQAQYAQTGELNLAYRPERWISFSVTGFVSEIDGLARIETRGLRPRAENAADILSIGGEAEIRLDHRESGFEGFLNVAYAYAEESLDDGTARSPLYPEVTFNAAIQYHLREPGMRFVLMNRLVSPRGADPSNVVRAGEPYELPLYDVLTVGVYSEGLQAIDGLDTELGLRFENALLQTYSEPGFLGIDVPGESWSIRATVSQEL